MKKQPLFGFKVIIILHRIFLALFYAFLRITVGLYCRIRYRLRYQCPQEVRRLKTPYLVLADHAHLMDMFFIGLGLGPVIHWVAADANFRTPFMKFVMTVLLGAISKSKNRSDMRTLKHMQQLGNNACVIGVYQEGECSWDGVNLPPVKGTDKLIRFLKIPVVYAHLQGAYLDRPRWSWTSNQTIINIRYELLISQKEVSSMPLWEITRRITEAGIYDDWAYQDSAAVPLRGNKRAEHVELVCFLCPECLLVNTITSKGNDFRCRSCGTRGSINTMGRFDWCIPAKTWPQGSPFRTVRDWNLWQINHYKSEIMKFNTGGSFDNEKAGNHLFWEDRDSVYLYRGRRNRKMHNLGLGTAGFYGDRITYESNGEKLILPLKEISSFSVFKQYYAEFYFNQQLHRFTFNSRSVSGYKWLMLFLLISDIQGKSEASRRG